MENIIQIKNKLKMINTSTKVVMVLPRIKKKVKTFDIVKVRRFALNTHTSDAHFPHLVTSLSASNF